MVSIMSCLPVAAATHIGKGVTPLLPRLPQLLLRAPVPLFPLCCLYPLCPTYTLCSPCVVCGMRICVVLYIVILLYCYIVIVWYGDMCMIPLCPLCPLCPLYLHCAAYSG
jgi:hypothetical protein